MGLQRRPSRTAPVPPLPLLTLPRDRYPLYSERLKQTTQEPLIQTKERRRHSPDAMSVLVICSRAVTVARRQD